MQQLRGLGDFRVLRVLAPSLKGELGWVFLLLLFFLTSCSSEQEPVEPEEPQEEMPIGFRATVESESNSRGGTRAETRPGDGELTTPLLKELGFGVYCWYTGSTNVAFTDDKDTNPSAHISSFA